MNRADDQGSTAFAIAADNGYLNILYALRVKNADMNSVDTDGDTPLICAAKQGHSADVRMLLENGADIEVQNRLGKTALDCAIELDQDDISELFRSMKPDHFDRIVSRTESLPPQTPDIAAAVTSSPLNDVKSLCDTMTHEAQAMCTHIYSRLHRLDTILSSGDLAPKK